MDLIPAQTTGNKSDNLYTVFCENKNMAKQTYLSACKKLFQINEWKATSNDILQTDFSLCNSDGEEVDRHPNISDYIKIDLVGPGSSIGDGFDWVRIEQIVVKEEDEDGEFTSIKVRPAACPLKKNTDIAHFFNDTATTTFIVSRLKNEVSAEIHGRNEEPNKNTSHITDNVRNTVVAKVAAVKFSDIQWKNLCKGLLS